MLIMVPSDLGRQGLDTEKKSILKPADAPRWDASDYFMMTVNIISRYGAPIWSGANFPIFRFVLQLKFGYFCARIIDKWVQKKN